MTNYKTLLNQITTFAFDVDGVFTNGSLQVSSSGELIRTMNVKDGFVVKEALKAGYEIIVISGGTNQMVKTRLKDLGITNIHLGVADKVECLEEFLEVYDIRAEHVAYMGDDIPDIYPMKMIGLATCPQDAVPEVKDICSYISHRKGGEGCVRDLIEQVMKTQGQWKY